MKDLLGQILQKAKDKNGIKIEKDHIHKHRDQTVNKDEQKYITINEPKPEDSEETFRNVLEKLQRLGNRGRDVLAKLNEQIGDEQNATKFKGEIDDVLKKNPEEIIETRGRVMKPRKFADAVDEANRKKRDLVLSTAKMLNEHDETGNNAMEEVILIQLF